MNDHAPQSTNNVFVVAASMLCWCLDNVLRPCFPRVRLSGSTPSLAESQYELDRASVDLLMVDVDDGYCAEALCQEAQHFNLVFAELLAQGPASLCSHDPSEAVPRSWPAEHTGAMS